MIVSKNAVYEHVGDTYIQCELHRKGDTYYLKRTANVVKALSMDYAVLTLPEIIAKFGRSAINDDLSSSSIKGAK